MSGVPKTTLRFSDFLEGLIEIKKAFVLMVMAYDGEKIQIKIIKGKRPRRQGAEGFQE